MSNHETRSALLVIDMLNDFVLEGAPLEVPSAREIISKIKRRISEERRRGSLIIYICDAHEPQDEEFKVWQPHAIKGTPGARVIDEIAPQKGDIIVEKTRYSGFYKTELEKILSDRGIKQLVIVGILTNICVFFTAADAVMRGFEVIVPKDCVTSIDERDHQFALLQMEKVLKVKIV